MEPNAYELLLISQERRADAMRDAERHRLIKALRDHDSPPGWSKRLRLRLSWLMRAPSGGGAGQPQPAPRKTASSPTV
jgi:hypothetical protein